MHTNLLKTLLLSGSLAAYLMAQGTSGQTPASTAKGNSGNTPQVSTPAPANGGQSSAVPQVQWVANPDLGTQLIGAGTSHIDFKSASDLSGLQVWLTPSLQGVTADPLTFDTITKDTVYTIHLSVAAPPTHTLAGTIHLRSTDGRTLAVPFPVLVKVVPSTPDDSIDEPTNVTAVVSAANYTGGSVTAGQVVSLFGTGLGPRTPKGAQVDATGRVSNDLADTEVLFNGISAPLLASSNGQVNAIVPQGIAADRSTSIVLTFKNNVAQPITLPVTPAAPALFTLDGSGKGQGAVLNQDSSVNAASKPAPRGSIITLFGTGFGATSTPVPDGTILGAELPKPTAPVSVTIGGAAAKVLYAGGAPGMVSGVVQINAEVPAEIRPGDKVTVVVTVGSSSSPATVTVSVQ